MFREKIVDISDDFCQAGSEMEVVDQDFNRQIEAGVFLCHECMVYFPIYNNTPIFLVYSTPFHEHFCQEFSEEMSQIASRYQIPRIKPIEGESFVSESFSVEWINYEYDGVLWEANYDDLRDRVMKEIGPVSLETKNRKFLEVGSGLGITTDIAQKELRVDAVGVDLSYAVFKASNYFQSNPFLHFVQASAFYLPFREKLFPIIYSRGVLHHTYSTEYAFKAAAKSCIPGGLFYLWVYGSGSIKSSWLRRFAYQLERIIRPFLSKHSNSFLATVILSILSLGYIAFNKFRRLGSSHIQKLTFKRAMHAARDRFTPRFAHRQDADEVMSWFQEEGFENLEEVDWKNMPDAEREDFFRNTGIRGYKKLETGAI